MSQRGTPGSASRLSRTRSKAKRYRRGPWAPRSYWTFHSQLNLYHLKMIAPERRRARSALYSALDPLREHQAIGYDYLADDVGAVEIDECDTRDVPEDLRCLDQPRPVAAREVAGRWPKTFARATTQRTATAATAASAAVPPALSVSIAARLARGCEVAAIPSRA